MVALAERAAELREHLDLLAVSRPSATTSRWRFSPSWQMAATTAWPSALVVTPSMKDLSIFSVSMGNRRR